MKLDLNDNAKVRIGKLAAVAVGCVAVVLGIVFERMNVNFLVGWAFSVAASANLPALVMLLFWKRTTKQGIIASVVVGMVSSLGWILLSGDTFKDVYGLDPAGLAGAVQPAGAGDDPAGLRRAGGGVAADAQAGTVRSSRATERNGAQRSGAE